MPAGRRRRAERRVPTWIIRCHLVVQRMRPFLLAWLWGAVVVLGRDSPLGLPPNVKPETVVRHHSFYPPLLGEHWAAPLKDWSFALSTVVADDAVRLTPDKQSREGVLWNDVPNRLKSFTVHAGLRVHSNSALGGDAMALWLTERHTTAGGPLVGTPDSGFRGIGVVFDSFDNDGLRDNPAVHVLVATDAASKPGDFTPTTDFHAERAGGCTYDFRNTDKDDVVVVQLAYDHRARQLTLHLSSHRATMMCTTVNDVALPDGLYFGASAHTGHLADCHDLHWLVVSSDEPEAEARFNEFSHLAEQEEKKRWHVNGF